MSDVSLFLIRFFLFALLHSLLALPSLKKRCAAHRSHLGKFYRLYYNLVSLILFGWVMAAFSHSEVLYVVPGALSLVLYFMQLMLLVMLVVCVSQTGVAGFLGVSGLSAGGLQTPKLVTDGCYRMVRHPLYLISTLFLLCNPVINVRWLLLTFVSVLYFLVGALLEEKRLIAEYGDEYRTYQSTVPFMIPRIFKRAGGCGGEG